jgi:hypothetical protein
VRSQVALQRALDKRAAAPVKAKKGKPALQRKGIAINNDAGLEREADQMGKAASRPQAFANGLQRMAAPQANGSNVLQKMNGDDDKKESGRSVRATTVAARLDPVDTLTRTRGAERKEAMVQAGIPVRRNVARQPFATAADGTRLWNGVTRPSWNGRDQTFIDGQATQHSAEHDRDEYECKTAEGTRYLPKKRDRIGSEQYVTVGHIQQWRDYCVGNCDPHDYDVEGGTIEAYSWDDIDTAYANDGNLRLEGNVYNSVSSARAYRSDPSIQKWK